jgi:integrase
MGQRGVTFLRLQYVHAFRDRHGKLRHYFRRPGHKQVPLPGPPGSEEFMAAYRAALAGAASLNPIGQKQSVPGTLRALVAAYLDCAATSSSPFKSLAPETQRTQRNILENLRELHGDKRVYRTNQTGQRALLLTRAHVQQMVNQKSNTPFAQRNFLNTLRAMFRWAIAEDRVPDDPTVGVTRRRIESQGYPTWSEENIAQYRRRHPLGTMARLALELLLATAARRGDVVTLGPKNIVDGAITFVASKTQRRLREPLLIPMLPELVEALEAMPPSKVVTLRPAATFLTTSSGQAFKSAASFGNWFRHRSDEARLPKHLSAHGLRKATARRLAELGCSAHQIAAVTRHATLTEVQRYTAAADRKRLAQEAMSKLIQGKP